MLHLYYESMTNDAQSLTGQKLIDYLDAQGGARKMNAGTASSRRSAVREVLNVAFGHAWNTTPFKSSDVDALLDKFAEAHIDDFTPESIQSYRSNFRRTVELSLGANQAEPTEGWLTYRFPIRDGVAAEMRLPADLTIAEARRLATLITALPVDAS